MTKSESRPNFYFTDTINSKPTKSYMELPFEFFALAALKLSQSLHRCYQSTGPYEVPGDPLPLEGGICFFFKTTSIYKFE